MPIPAIMPWVVIIVLRFGEKIDAVNAAAAIKLPDTHVMRNPILFTSRSTMGAEQSKNPLKNELISDTLERVSPNSSAIACNTIPPQNAIPA